MNYFQQTLISSLEYVRDQLEKHDQELQNRKRIFAPEVGLVDEQIQEKVQDKPAVENDDKSTGSSDNKLETGEKVPAKAEIVSSIKISPQYKRLQLVSCDLLDISSHYAVQAHEGAKQYRLYKQLDLIIDFEQKQRQFQEYFNILFELGVKFYENNKIVAYIAASISQQQEQQANHLVIAAEIEPTESNCACLNSLKMLAGKAHALLDHNCDGKLDLNDMKNSLLGAYKILTNISLADINEMKLELYRKAIVYMKDELRNDQYISQELKQDQIKQE